MTHRATPAPVGGESGAKPIKVRPERGSVDPPESHTLFSEANRRRFEHWVWQPDPETHGDGPFPLLLLLHGVNDGGGSVWWTKGRAHDTAERLVDSGEVAPFVVLMAPDTGAELGTGYCDWADGTTSAETYLIDELLPWAESNLPVAGAPRWISGLSMGGYGSWLLALRHPGLFASATSTSGFFDPDRLLRFVSDGGVGSVPAERMWGDEAGRAAHDVWGLIADTDRRNGLRLALDCGRDDALIEENRWMHARLAELDVAHGWAEHEGDHTWDYWSAHLADHILFHANQPGPL